MEKSLDASLEALNTTYLDLFLIHWPIAFNRDGSVYNKELTDDPFPTWQKLEELVKKGKIRNILYHRISGLLSRIVSCAVRSLLSIPFLMLCLTECYSMLPSLDLCSLFLAQRTSNATPLKQTLERTLIL